MSIIQEKIISKIQGTAMPKPANDQNTDDIVPARFLKEITFSKMGNYAYYDERFKEGKKIEEHPFNNSKYASAKILVAGANYGCGSSREHAPQALKRFGINAIIAESFSEIFAGNCASIGLIGITVSKENISKLIETINENPKTEFTIDLEKKKILFNEKEIPFDIIEARRQSFLNGTWDAMAILQKNESKIKELEKKLAYLQFK